MVDEKSVMTYLAQFPQARYRPSLGSVEDLDLSPFVSATTTLTLHTASGSTVPDVTILGPSGSLLDCEVTKSSSTLYYVKYQPKETGEHQVFYLAPIKIFLLIVMRDSLCLLSTLL